MLEHDWPGNVRELHHAVQRAVRRSGGATIDLKAINFLRRKPACVPKTTADETPAGGAVSERDWIAEALARNGFRRAQTAEELGMTTRTLYNKIKKHGLQT